MDNNIATAAIVVGIVLAVYFWKIIFRTVFGIFSLVLGLVLIVGACGLVASVFTSSGLVPGCLAAAALFLFLYFVGRDNNSGGGYSDDEDYSAEQQREDYRRREDQQREARRLQKNYEESCRRNPW